MIDSRVIVCLGLLSTSCQGFEQSHFKSIAEGRIQVFKDFVIHDEIHCTAESASLRIPQIGRQRTPPTLSDHLQKVPDRGKIGEFDLLWLATEVIA